MTAPKAHWLNEPLIDSAAHLSPRLLLAKNLMYIQYNLCFLQSLAIRICTTSLNQRFLKNIFERKRIAMTTLFNYLPGKSDPENPNNCLPLWMHSFDTAGIMAHLVNDWLPDEIRCHISAQITNGTTFEQLCRFLSLTHDIGKATPLFACRICHSLLEIRDLLYKLGLLPPPEY